MHVYLVGTNHANQLTGYKDGAAEKFRLYLAHICNAETIDLLAEELNEEAIVLWQRKGAQDSTARLLATAHEIPHLFCDPNAHERRALGIPSYEELRIKFGYGRARTHEQEANLAREERKFWPIREECWRKKVAAISPLRCLFVVGSDHVESFAELLSGHGVVVEIKTRRWEPQP